jgi:hypothetical protein
VSAAGPPPSASRPPPTATRPATHSHSPRRPQPLACRLRPLVRRPRLPVTQSRRRRPPTAGSGGAGHDQGQDDAAVHAVEEPQVTAALPEGTACSCAGLPGPARVSGSSAHLCGSSACLQVPTHSSAGFAAPARLQLQRASGIPTTTRGSSSLQEGEPLIDRGMWLWSYLII